MKCWNCSNPLDELLVCSRCGMPQSVGVLGPFDAFGLPPKLRWEEGELLSAYETLARRCHPDLFRAHRDSRVLTASQTAMRALNDAYRTVRDPESRLRYVLSALGHAHASTRTVPEGLQDSVQILDRVLTAAEKAQAAGDRAAWETEQDHLASLQVKVENARDRSNQMLRRIAEEWDRAVATAGEEWPDMSDDWVDQAVRLAGERAYLSAVETRIGEARRKPVETPA